MTLVRIVFIPTRNCAHIRWMKCIIPVIRQRKKAIQQEDKETRSTGHERRIPKLHRNILHGSKTVVLLKYWFNTGFKCLMN